MLQPIFNNIYADRTEITEFLQFVACELNEIAYGLHVVVEEAIVDANVVACESDFLDWGVDCDAFCCFHCFDVF